MSKSFVIGCTHFGHANIIRLANRPFKTQKEMDEAMIANWNNIVSEDDVVYHLGDFAWGGPEAERDYMFRLNGAKVFITGDHDRHDLGRSYHSERVEIGGRRVNVVMFHYPIDEWDGWHRGAVHLHCHTHSHKKVSAPGRVNVSVEAHEYTPVPLDRAVRLAVQSRKDLLTTGA